VAIFDSRGGLHRGRADIEADPRFYRKWELCQATNPERWNDMPTAMKDADVLIALSRPGPDVIKPEWVRGMARNAIVFACANPVPEIYPHAAKEAGALVVATGRGDFPNPVNNSLGFPGILKGALLVRARKITDAMAIAAAQTIAAFAERQGLSPDRIMPLMTDEAVFSETAAAVARQAAADGVARRVLSPERVQERARKDIAESHAALELLMTSGLIPPPPEAMIRRSLEAAIAAAQ
jgi:malate dehydrogenase (oxaloacetate-decarboxylating)